jgi:hypothetical protein
MTTDPTGRSSRQETCCDLCGDDVRIVNSVKDDFGSYTICAGCAELWTTYLMHHPSTHRRLSPGSKYPGNEFKTD